MNGILFLIPIALGLGLLGLFAFFWAVGRGQFDDLDGAALRIFIDDAEPTSTRIFIDDGDDHAAN
jgi:cbb3-type cytochrome oxidase maturation protein